MKKDNFEDMVKSVRERAEKKMKILCKNIRLLRQKEKLSIEAMANKLGIGIKSLEKLENGVLSNRVGGNMLINLYENFKITPEQILAETIDFDKQKTDIKR